MLPRLCFAPFFALLLAASGPARAALPEPVVRLLGAAGIPDEAVAILVLRGETTVLAHQELRAMAPASTMKLLTTMAALERLGPAFRGRTELRTDGRVVGSELRGDLILRGGADPDFSSAALEQMLIKLRGAGIRTVKGRLVIDRSLFQPTRADLDAAPFDATPEARYNVIPDALLLNANLHNIQLRSSGHTLALAIWPQQAGVTVGSDMTLIDADCTRWEDGWLRPTVTRAKAGKLSVMLHGTFPRNCTVSYQVNVLDRQDYVERELRQLWRRMGGVLTGTTVEGVTPADTLLLAEHVARALPEVIREVNKVSDNALARTLFLSLGSLEGDVQTGSRPLAPAPVSTAAWAFSSAS